MSAELVSAGPGRPRLGLAGGIGVALGVLALVTFASIAYGSRDVGLHQVWLAMTTDDRSGDLIVLRDMRLPRTILGLLVGAALGLSGALLQALSRNALADPGVLGISAGAAAAVSLGVVFLGTAGADTYVWYAFAGAAVATVVVYAIASFGREGATPVKLALAGASVAAVCSAVTSAVILRDPDALEELRRWQVGSLGGRYAPVLEQLAPYLVIGIVLTLFTGRMLNALALGTDLARAFGVNVGRARLLVLLLVTVLCGAATAACGPIVFVGLMVPHVARLICGPDYRWILPYTLVLGPIMVVGCDLIGRLLLSSGLEVGVVVGLVGAPVFIAIVRYRRAVEL